MRITFYRQGYANNSSSSHSLIFTNEELKTDEDTEFGWEFFTASNKDSKFRYLFLCLFDSWCRLDGRNYLHPQISIKDYKSFLFDQLYFKLKLDKAEILSIANQEEEGLRYLCINGYVDHQSILTFPCHRKPSLGLNFGFALEIFKEICNNNYVILGGNDNDDHDHPDYDLDLKNQKTQIKLFLRNLIEKNPKEILCEKDNKTGEWIVSRISGNLLKVIF